MSMYVITHKHFNYQKLPVEYTPILVGANKNSNPDHFVQDNEGDNISDKNFSYCELTGLYWMWKHSKSQNIGLSHYRRYFANYESRKVMYLHELVYGEVKPIGVDTLDKYLKDGYDWIASQPEYGGPGTIWEQFDRNHHITDLEILERVIYNEFHDYYNSFEKVIRNNNVSSFFNMFYTKKTLMNEYCEWLFSVLKSVEYKTNVLNYDSYQQRLYGFFAERLMNVWLDKNNLKIKYLPVFQTDNVSRRYVIKLIKERFIYQ